MTSPLAGVYDRDADRCMSMFEGSAVGLVVLLLVGPTLLGLSLTMCLAASAGYMTGLLVNSVGQSGETISKIV